MLTDQLCVSCGCQITEAQLQNSEAIRHGPRVYCRVCAELILMPEDLVEGGVKRTPRTPLPAAAVAAPAGKSRKNEGGFEVVEELKVMPVAPVAPVARVVPSVLEGEDTWLSPIKKKLSPPEAPPSIKAPELKTPEKSAPKVIEDDDWFKPAKNQPAASADPGEATVDYVAPPRFSDEPPLKPSIRRPPEAPAQEDHVDADAEPVSSGAAVKPDDENEDEPEVAEKFAKPSKVKAKFGRPGKEGSKVVAPVAPEAEADDDAEEDGDDQEEPAEEPRRFSSKGKKLKHGRLKGKRPFPKSAPAAEEAEVVAEADEEGTDDEPEAPPIKKNSQRVPIAGSAGSERITRRDRTSRSSREREQNDERESGKKGKGSKGARAAGMSSNMMIGIGAGVFAVLLLGVFAFSGGGNDSKKTAVQKVDEEDNDKTTSQEYARRAKAREDSGDKKAAYDLYGKAAVRAEKEGSTGQAKIYGIHQQTIRSTFHIND